MFRQASQEKKSNDVMRLSRKLGVKGREVNLVTKQQITRTKIEPAIR